MSQINRHTSPYRLQATRILLAILSVALLLSLPACADLPYIDSVPGETFSYRLYGREHIQKVVVYDGTQKRATVTVDGGTVLQEPYENYGLVTGDFDQDGIEDFYVILSSASEVTTIACYRATTDGKYIYDATLSKLHNLLLDRETGSLIAYSESRQVTAQTKDGETLYDLSYTLCAYTYRDGTLSPISALRLTYYTDEDLWVYSRLGYLGTGQDAVWTELEEKWLTEDTLPDYDFRPGKNGGGALYSDKN